MQFYTATNTNTLWKWQNGGLMRSVVTYEFYCGFFNCFINSFRTKVRFINCFKCWFPDIKITPAAIHDCFMLHVTSSLQKKCKGQQLWCLNRTWSALNLKGIRIHLCHTAILNLTRITSTMCCCLKLNGILTNANCRIILLFLFLF